MTNPCHCIMTHCCDDVFCANSLKSEMVFPGDSTLPYAHFCMGVETNSRGHTGGNSEGSATQS